MSKPKCIVCSEELDKKDVFNIHYMCFVRNKREFKAVEIEYNKVKKCVICNRTLPPKSTKTYHKKCILEQQKQEEKRFIIQVSRDVETCTVQY